jgi:hypothetical protein
MQVITICGLLFSVLPQPNSGLDRLAVEVTHTVGLIWTSDRLVAEATTLHNTQQTWETNIHALKGIRTRDPSNQAVAGLRLKPHGHRDQPFVKLVIQIYFPSTAEYWLI